VIDFEGLMKGLRNGKRNFMGPWGLKEDCQFITVNIVGILQDITRALFLRIGMIGRFL
jgi:hypothetical protein